MSIRVFSLIVVAFTHTFSSTRVSIVGAQEFENVCIRGDSTNTNKDMRLKVSAGACYDSLDVATAYKSAAANGLCGKDLGHPFKDDDIKQEIEGCDPAQNPFAKECRHHCRTCCYLPQFRCESKDEHKRFCELNFDKCSGNTEQSLLVRRLCPAWCGTCLELDEAGVDLCRDTVPYEECKELASSAEKCRNGASDAELRGKCAFYCQEEHNVKSLCDLMREERKKQRDEKGGGGTPAKDVADNCRELKARGLCTDPVYKEEMQRLCATTCATTQCQCDGEEWPPCRDFDTNVCKYWKINGFCWNSHYYLAERKRYCGITCELCGETESSLGERRKKPNEGSSFEL